jgi:hypothetical protein
MKIKILIILFFLSSSSGMLFAWGEEGHALIARKAVELLSDEMTDFKKWKQYIEDHSSDPDKRKKDDKSEEPKHYIDIDFYREFRMGEMIYDKEALVGRYGDSIVTAMGILPWATLDTYNGLVYAFKQKNRDRMLVYVTDLAHYVADGHQPMHTVLNYDGQLSNQKGLHARYEIHMVNKYLKELENSFYHQAPYYIDNPLDYIFYYITNANLISDLVFTADNAAVGQAGERDSDDYYKILWFRTKYITTMQMNNAANALASMIHSAWLDAGKPDLNDFE